MQYSIFNDVLVFSVLATGILKEVYEMVSVTLNETHKYCRVTAVMAHTTLGMLIR